MEVAVSRTEFMSFDGSPKVCLVSGLAPCAPLSNGEKLRTLESSSCCLYQLLVLRQHKPLFGLESLQIHLRIAA